MRYFNLFIVLILSTFIISCNAQKGAKMENTATPQATKQAPDFTLKDQDGKEHKLSNYSNQYVLIYFYPKDDTPGCTIEACAIRDNYDGFKERNIQVFGISADNADSHKKFIAKYHLPFTLLSDEEHIAAKLYNADGMFFRRVSYLIGPGSKIIKEYPNVSPDKHAAEILADHDVLSKI